MCGSQLIILSIMVVPMVIACAMMILGPPQRRSYRKGRY